MNKQIPLALFSDIKVVIANFQIYGNIVTNIDNCYCIESRRVSRNEEKVGGHIINMSFPE